MEVGLLFEERVLSLKGYNEAGPQRVENYKLEKLGPTVNDRVRHYCCGETDNKKDQTGSSKSFCPLAFHSPSPTDKAPWAASQQKKKCGLKVLSQIHQGEYTMMVLIAETIV